MEHGQQLAHIEAGLAGVLGFLLALPCSHRSDASSLQQIGLFTVQLLAWLRLHIERLPSDVTLPTCCCLDWMRLELSVEEDRRIGERVINTSDNHLEMHLCHYTSNTGNAVQGEHGLAESSLGQSVWLLSWVVQGGC